MYLKLCVIGLLFYTFHICILVLLHAFCVAICLFKISKPTPIHFEHLRKNWYYYPKYNSMYETAFEKKCKHLNMFLK